MNKIFFEFTELMSEPIFFLNDSSEVVYMNTNAKYFLDFLGNESLDKFLDVKNIMDKYNSKERDSIALKCNLNINNIDIDIEVYLKKIDFIDSVQYLLLFDDTLIASKRARNIMNAIGDMISVHNRNGQLLSYNNVMSDMMYENLGLNIHDMIGEGIHRLVEWGLAEDTITDKVIKERKKVVKNVTHYNGKTITYTGIPVFAQDGEIKNVVLTGRDVSSLMELKNNFLETQQKNEEYKKRIKEMEDKKKDKSIIYSSKKMENIIKIGKRVAKTDSPVFIMGSSGVGKEEIAKYIHKNSDRVDKNFIAVNCAAIPADLLEMEFFGYEEGSFTGAKKVGKKGLLEIANEGTMFLDEGNFL